MNSQACVEKTKKIISDINESNGYNQDIQNRINALCDDIVNPTLPCLNKLHTSAKNLYDVKNLSSIIHKGEAAYKFERNY